MEITGTAESDTVASYSQRKIQKGLTTTRITAAISSSTGTSL
jgi:hypothetical protein